VRSLIVSCARINHCSKAQWETVLRETAFAETDSLPGLIGPTGGEGQIGLLARKSYEQISAPTVDQINAPEEKSWVVFSDASGLGDALVTQLRAFGATCRVVTQGDEFVRRNDAFTLRPGILEDWHSLLKPGQALHPRELFTFGVSIRRRMGPTSRAILMRFCILRRHSNPPGLRRGYGWMW
jgi:hypothetical protein